MPRAVCQGPRTQEMPRYQPEPLAMTRDEPTGLRATAAHNVAMLPTENGADTAEWRRSLIQQAEHNIMLSAYCGGREFDATLELIGKCLQEVTNLEALIILHPGFLREQAGYCHNLSLIADLSRQFPNRFQVVKAGMTRCGGKYAGNHSKCLLIDYGRYYILGGSCWTDGFAKTGTNQSRSDYLRTTWQVSREEYQVQSDGSMLGNLESLVLAGSFRDMDFVIKPDDYHDGLQLYRQMLFLAYKWRTHEVSGTMSAASWDLADGAHEPWPALVPEPLPTRTNTVVTAANEATAATSADDLVSRMLGRPEPKSLPVAKEPPGSLRSDQQWLPAIPLELYFSGPENHASKYQAALLEAIYAAQSSIVLGQSYFHPTPVVMSALVAACERGVHVKVITTRDFRGGPVANYLFGPHNRYNIYDLASSLSPDSRNRFTAYEFQHGNTFYHKKITIIDNKIFAGSSNFGYKGLAVPTDHEINFAVNSPDLVAAVLKILDDDLRHCSELAAPESISPFDVIRSTIYSGLKPWLG